MTAGLGHYPKYMSQPLRPPEEMRADILALERETESEIVSDRSCEVRWHRGNREQGPNCIERPNRTAGLQLPIAAVMRSSALELCCENAHIV